MNNNQSSAIDIPKFTRIVASSTPDGHTMLSSIVTDGQGHQMHRHNGATTDTGISPTYYTSCGTPVQVHQGNSHSLGSPVYGDKSRVFFSHNSMCSCKCV